MAPLEILRGTRELLSDPSRWTTGAEERNAAGETSDDAGPEHFVPVCWCVLGATGQVGGFGPSLFADDELRNTLRAETHFSCLDTFNDAPETTHADVLSLIDRTIARLEAT